FSNRSADETRMAEIMPSILGIHYASKYLKKWMRTSRRAVGRPFQPASTRVIYQPLGVVSVIVPWNYPLLLAIGPLVGALPAGNRVRVRVSASTAAVSELLRALLARIFPADLVAVVTWVVEIGGAVPSLPSDYLLLPDAARVGKHVIRAAADNLTPVTLDPGG